MAERVRSTVKTFAQVRRALEALQCQLDALTPDGVAPSDPVGGVGSLSGPPFSDAVALIHDQFNADKQVRLDGGLVSPGRTRVITMPDEDVRLGSTGPMVFIAAGSQAGAFTG